MLREAAGGASVLRKEVHCGRVAPLRLLKRRSQVVASGCARLAIGVQDARRELLYIGKAGTITQTAARKKQGLRKRLGNLQGRERRAVAFQRWIDEGEHDGLEIVWFVTWNDFVQVLPLKAEVDLLQAYYEDHGRLPPKNTAA